MPSKSRPQSLEHFLARANWPSTQSKINTTSSKMPAKRNPCNVPKLKVYAETSPTKTEE